MMETLVLVSGAALWLGLLTSISPCPLATNIAAISYVGKQVDRPLRVLFSGLLYTLGRSLSYVLIAFIVVKSLLSVSDIAIFLQTNLNQALGPLLILVGLLLFEIVRWPWSGRGSPVYEKIKNQVGDLGMWGAGLLGLVFALTFCPVSAALFFGSLVPLAIRHDSSVVLPVIYGIGTAVPVVAVAFILAFAANRLAQTFAALAVAERWMRRLTATAFIAVGAYYTLVYLFGVS